MVDDDLTVLALVFMWFDAISILFGANSSANDDDSTKDGCGGGLCYICGGVDDIWLHLATFYHDLCTYFYLNQPKHTQIYLEGCCGVNARLSSYSIF